jgi:hypothetical protein
LKENQEQKRKGFHCLGGWSGSHRQFESEIKKQLRDPDSFEHIETRVTAISKENSHTIFMKYRAKNGFGGMNVETAIGTYRNDDCSVLSVGSQ